LLRFGHEIRWCFAVAHAPQSHALCAWWACWPQDVANMRNKLKNLSEETLRFGYEIRWCFAAAHAPQSHALCASRACWPQHVANMRNKLKNLSSSEVSEETLSRFLGFLCYVLGTKLGGVLLLRMRHKAMHFVLGGLVGHKMWQTCVTS